MTIEESEILIQYFPHINSKQLTQFGQLSELFIEWNQKINLVSRKDIDHLFVHHILHSLAIAKVVTFNAQHTVWDVGTGGGFPGIPLSILFPDTQFVLIDSIAKKIKVVDDLANQLALTNVQTQTIRVEQIKTKTDYIVSRAVTRIPEMYHWVKMKINKPKPNSAYFPGIFYLKGGDLYPEMKGSGINYAEHLISDFYKEPYFETKKVIYVPIG